MTARGRCVRPGDGVPLAMVGGHLLVGGEETGGRLAVMQSAAPPGDSAPLHVHHDADPDELAHRHGVTFL